ncbi:LAFE_0G16182g1_1 [Lachancea fermentati]|uniref:LAFE_0G16182g1_1 n=1 Tax=Lachancea fermentati TaxID=4955 RepID=A0A1G4MIK4_LACFM|nr:LAFE_0G16182g1_1 [Lachancea fermentati]
MQTLYKQNSNITQSTGSFLASAPVELTTVKGYEDFMAKQQKSNANVTTILSEDKSCGYVLKGGEAIATISGEAKDHLLALTGGGV